MKFPLIWLLACIFIKEYKYINLRITRQNPCAWSTQAPSGCTCFLSHSSTQQWMTSGRFHCCMKVTTLRSLSTRRATRLRGRVVTWEYKYLIAKNKKPMSVRGKRKMTSTYIIFIGWIELVVFVAGGRNFVLFSWIIEGTGGRPSVRCAHWAGNAEQSQSWWVGDG